jgi:hypothetical protein
MTKQIELTRGYVALVDDADYTELARYKWYAHTNNRSGLVYARRAVTRPGTRSQRTVAMHRQLMGVLDAGRKVLVDHWSGDTLDNQRGNLRVVGHKANGENRPRLNLDNTSGYRGVSWEAKPARWRVRVRHHGRLVSGGYYTTAAEAGRVAEALRLQLYGAVA